MGRFYSFMNINCSNGVQNDLYVGRLINRAGGTLIIDIRLKTFFNGSYHM